MRGNAVRNRQAEHWDWDWLDLAPSAATGVSDLDCVLTGVPAIIENHRGRFPNATHPRFLVIETKALEEPLGLGQALLLHNLSRLEEMTVWVLRGQDSHPTWILEVSPSIDAGEIRNARGVETDRDDVQRRVRAWLRGTYDCP